MTVKKTNRMNNIDPMKQNLNQSGRLRNSNDVYDLSGGSGPGGDTSGGSYGFIATCPALPRITFATSLANLADHPLRPPSRVPIRQPTTVHLFCHCDQEVTQTSQPAIRLFKLTPFRRADTVISAAR